METHFYTMELFFSLTKFFPWTFRKIPYYSFLCPVTISGVMNAKKISKFEREVKSNGNTLLPHTFFFSFTSFFLWTRRKIPYSFFLCPVSISRIMNAKKNLEIREGSQEQWKHTSKPWNYFFLSLNFPHKHSEIFPTIFFMPRSYFSINECNKKISKFEREVESNGNTRTLNNIVLPRKKIIHLYCCNWSKIHALHLS